MPGDASPPIIQYWHDEDVPGYLGESLSSCERHNPDLEHLLFNRSTAAAFIEERCSPRELAAFRSCAVPAMQSDYFRYCAGLALGGIYLDVDHACAAPFRPLLEDGAEGQLFKRSIGMMLNGVFVFRSPGHPFLRLALDVTTANIESRALENVPGVTGPMVFAGLVMLYELGSIDAFLQVAGSGAGRWQPRLMGEVVGSYDRVAEAFETVGVYPVERLNGLLDSRDLRHARNRHWLRWESSIYVDRVSAGPAEPVGRPPAG
jgi:hypothetical protein